MNRNILYFVLGVLVMALLMLTYQRYLERRQSQGMQIDIAPGGVLVEARGMD